MEYKCYNVDNGCMGLTESGDYKLFDSEADYKEYYNEHKNDE